MYYVSVQEVHERMIYIIIIILSNQISDADENTTLL